jgi:ESF2/ABP1 family protein
VADPESALFEPSVDGCTMSEEVAGISMGSTAADGTMLLANETDDYGPASVPQCNGMTLHQQKGTAAVEHQKPISSKALEKMRRKVKRSGIVYMSHIPPHMKPLKLRQMLEVHAPLGRIYMTPKQHGVSGKGSHLQASKRGKSFSEAWIEFEDKKEAKSLAELFNGKPMGGKRRSKYHDELWTLKYLPKFKWDHLTEEVGELPMLNASLM